MCLPKETLNDFTIYSDLQGCCNDKVDYQVTVNVKEEPVVDPAKLKI